MPLTCFGVCDYAMSRRVVFPYKVVGHRAANRPHEPQTGRDRPPEPSELLPSTASPEPSELLPATASPEPPRTEDTREQ